jgi:hypothetical protein
LRDAIRAGLAETRVMIAMADWAEAKSARPMTLRGELVATELCPPR